MEEGSFFDGVPTGGDIYVLKMIIHDWPEDQAIEILRNVRAAAEVGTTLLLIETVLSDHNRDHVGNWTNLEMLLMNAGRERTAAEYRGLLQRAGFQVTRVVPTASPLALWRPKPPNEASSNPVYVGSSSGALRRRSVRRNPTTLRPQRLAGRTAPRQRSAAAVSRR